MKLPGLTKIFNRMKKLFRALVIIFALLVLIVIIKTATFSSMQLKPEAIELPAFPLPFSRFRQ